MMTIEEKMKCVEEFKKSGMRAKAYAEEKGIPLTTLKYWLQRYKEPEKFGKIEISHIDEKTTKECTKGKEIQFVCENIRIELKDGYDKEIFKRIVEVITEC